MSAVKSLFEDLVANGHIDGRNLTGCSRAELDAIETHFASPLPDEYKQFLLIAGKGAGLLFKGSDIFFPRLLELQGEAEELLEELGKTDLLPEDAMVFYMHQGYELDFFMPGMSDPPVFQFYEGQDEPLQSWPGFSEFIRESIEAHLKQWKTLNPTADSG